MITRTCHVSCVTHPLSLVLAQDVLVLVLVSAGTVEEDIQAKARQKRELDKKVI